MSEFVSKNGINTDLVDYLVYRGYHIVKHSQGYKVKVKSLEKHAGDLSSLSIFKDRHGWKRWSDGTHGSDAIEFCRVVFGMSFQEAVKELGGSMIHVESLPLEKEIQTCKSGLQLPERYQGRFSRLYAYLIQTRGLAPEIVNRLVQDDCIYQDVRNNVVFIGRDEFQQARFACLRSTISGSSFRIDCKGSDKRYSFSVAGVDHDSLYIFESPIDLLSAATLANLMTGNRNTWLQNSRLSLAGSSDEALNHYLSLHQSVRNLHFWLDNDLAGRKSSEFLCRKYSAQGFRVWNHCPRNKDMNEDLKEWLYKKQ